MEKIFTFAMIATGLSILLAAAGLQTAGSVVLDQFGVSFDTIQNIKAFSLFSTLLVTAVATLISSGIIMGTIGRGNPEIFVTALYATPLIALIGDMVSVIVLGGTGWVGYLIFLIMGPLLVGYTISLYDWIRGRD